MKVVSHTAELAVIGVEPWELSFVVAASRWVLSYVGTGKYGRVEISAVMGITLEEAEASLRTIEQLSADEPVVLSALEARSARGFMAEVIFRYRPLKVITDDANFKELMGTEISDARAFFDQFDELRQAM